VIRPLQIYAKNEEMLEVMTKMAANFESRMVCHGMEVQLLRNDERIAECKLALEDDHFIFESVLGFSEAHCKPAGIKVARKIMAEKFHSGLWFVNEARSVREFYREFWYSDGALKGQRDGKRLKQFSSSVVYALADPDASARYVDERKRIIESL
jgi:hypothetical protein